MEYILNRMFAAVLAVTPWAVGLIAVLLWLRRAGSRKLSPRFFQLAFLILAVRLALPIDFSLPDAPVKAPMPAAIQQELEEMTFEIPQISVGQVVAPAIIQPEPEAAPQDPAPQPPMPVLKKTHKNMLPFLWFGGVALFLFTQLGMYAVFCTRLLRRRSPAEEDIRELARKQFGRPVRVYWMEEIASPMLAGLFRPAVYLPKDGVHTEDLPYMLAHEACHARRKDVPAQFLLLAAQAVHWFDPMVHWMAHAARQDMERGCDEAVLAGRDLEYRRAYGSAVLSSLKSSRRSRTLTLSTGFSSGTDLKRRFKEMFDMNQKSKGLPLLAALAALVAAGSFLVSCGAAAPKAPAETSSGTPAFVESTSDQPESESAGEPESKPASEAEPEKASNEEPQSDAQQMSSQPQLKLMGTAQSQSAGPILQVAELPQPEAAFVLPLRKNNILVSSCMTERHKGADLVADEGDEILAMQSGTVKKAEFESDKGNYVLIEGSDGFSTLYAHCKELKVSAGDTVKAGDVIATVGMTGKSTGNHLHLEIRKGGECLQPIEYLKGAGMEISEESQSGLAENLLQRVACDE